MLSLVLDKYSSTILLVLSIILLILAFNLSSKKESFRYRQQQPKLTAGSFGKLVSQLQHNEDKPLINNLNI